MRKVFVLLVGLFLLASFAACSKDETTPTPPPGPRSLEITTASVPAGYTCGPYNVAMQARGGTPPYVWSIADGGSLPEGIALSADGEITGVMTVAGDYPFTVRCTDSADPANVVDKDFSLNMSVPSNPSMAIFFNRGATVCSSSTTAWTPLDCYVYVMLEGSDVACAQACEFRVRLTDKDGADLDAGSQYAIFSVTLPSGAISLGDLFDGIAISFQQPRFGPDPILVASFSMLLMEDLNNLSFKFDVNPGGTLAVASCDVGYPIVPVTGREAAVNY
jgi:hypothetical protein